MTAVDRERLGDLAAAATPGPWERGEVMGYLEDGGDVERTLWHSEVEPGICAGTTVEDAEFIAAANPAAITALLAELAEAEIALRAENEIRGDGLAVDLAAAVLRADRAEAENARLRAALAEQTERADHEDRCAAQATLAADRWRGESSGRSPTTGASNAKTAWCTQTPCAALSTGA